MDRVQDRAVHGEFHKRQANFELLRIKAMMMIIMLHYFSKGNLLVGFEKPLGVNGVAAWVLDGFCASAVNVFVLMSGYFLVEAGFKWKRLLTLWLQVMFYSVGVTVVLLLCGIWKLSDMTLYTWADCIFPIQSEHYWFATAYLFLYLFSPVLNAGMKAMTKIQHRNVILALIAVFSLTKSIIPVHFNMDHYGYDVIWFMCLYVIAGYIRLYGIPFFTEEKSGGVQHGYLSGKKRLFAKSVLCYIAATAAMVTILMVVGLFYAKTGKLGGFVTYPYQYNHILNLLASIALFYSFYHYEVKGKFADIVCRISPYVFGVYLLHEHLGLRYLWTEWFQVEKYGKTALLLPHLIVTVICIFMAGIVVDCVRSLLFKGVEKMMMSCKKQQ